MWGILTNDPMFPYKEISFFKCSKDYFNKILGDYVRKKGVSYGCGPK